MKREVKRTKPLPAFRLDVAELGLLWQRCADLFDVPAEVRSTLTIELPSESLEFKTFQELEGFADLPPEIRKLSLRFFDDNRHLSVRSASLIGDRPVVDARGESEAWCAGAVETVYAFIANHKAPYSWFIGFPFGWLMFVLCFAMPAALTVMQKVSPEPVRLPPFAFASWLLLLAACSFMFFFRNSLFPMSTLTIRESRGFLGRNLAEIGLLVAFLSFLVSCIGLFLK